MREMFCSDQLCASVPSVWFGRSVHVYCMREMFCSDQLCASVPSVCSDVLSMCSACVKCSALINCVPPYLVYGSDILSTCTACVKCSALINCVLPYLVYV